MQRVHLGQADIPADMLSWDPWWLVATLYDKDEYDKITQEIIPIVSCCWIHQPNTGQPIGITKGTVYIWPNLSTSRTRRTLRLTPEGEHFRLNPKALRRKIEEMRALHHENTAAQEQRYATLDARRRIIEEMDLEEDTPPSTYTLTPEGTLNVTLYDTQPAEAKEILWFYATLRKRRQP